MKEEEKYEFDFTVGWTAALLQGLSEHPDNTYDSFENCACFHYNANNMNDIVQNYIGNLDEFLDFLSDTWNWKITKFDDGKKIVIDENKDFCVCPVVHKIRENVPKSICNCSEHFAKKMFSSVTGHPVAVKVIRSIVRDGKPCMYEITL